MRAAIGLLRELLHALLELLQARHQAFRESVALRQFTLGALATAFHFLLHFGGASGFLLRAVVTFRGGLLRTFRFAQRESRGFGGERGLLAPRIGGGKIGLESIEFGTTLQRTGTGGRARQEHRAMFVDECLAAVERTHLAEQRAYPARRRATGLHAAGQGATLGAIIHAQLGDHIQRQQQQRSGLRFGVPATHRGGGFRVTHDDGVHGGAEVALHESRGLTIGGDEVGERSENSAVTEPRPFLEQSGAGRGQPHTFALECGERIHASFQLRAHFDGTGERAA